MSHHVVLVSIDALRADRLGCYGNPRPVSPHIDQLVSESVVFRNATSPVTWTLPGHMSMLAGLEPPVHGCVSPMLCYPPESLPFPLLFEMMDGGGYLPRAVTGGGYMEPSSGFGRGVDDFHVIFPLGEAIQATLDHIERHDRTFSFFHTYAVHDYPRVVSQPRATRYVAERDPEYSGCFPTDMDFHSLIAAMGSSPEVPPATRRDLDFLTDLYDSAITSADEAIGAFINQLKKTGRWDDTTLIITSDHGESLGEQHVERQYWSHGGPPYHEQLRIPLIIRPAAQLEGMLEPEVFDEAVSLIDLPPTILDLVGLSFDRAAFDGISLMDLCQGQISAFETRVLFFHSCEDTTDRYIDPRLYGTAMTWRGDRKVMFDHRTAAMRELYDLGRDPAERHNIIDGLDQDVYRQIDEDIAQYWKQVAARAHSPESRQIDNPIVLERLAALGYV